MACGTTVTDFALELDAEVVPIPRKVTEDRRRRCPAVAKLAVTETSELLLFRFQDNSEEAKMKDTLAPNPQSGRLRERK